MSHSDCCIFPFFLSYRNAQICFTSSIPAASACWVTKLVWDAYRRAWRTQAIPAVLGWPCQIEVEGSQSLTLGSVPSIWRALSENWIVQMHKFGKCHSAEDRRRRQTDVFVYFLRACLLISNSQVEQTLFISFALLSLLFALTHLRNDNLFTKVNTALYLIWCLSSLCCKWLF